MKAVQKLSIEVGDIGCVDVPKKHPKSGEVQIRIAYAGICGTDMSIYKGEKEIVPPIIMGHEFSGVITEIGKDVTDWQIGERVVAETTKQFCGHCEYCKTGRHSLCPKRGAFGQEVDGVFAESICQSAEMLHRIPAGVDLMEAALTEPAACVYHAVYDLNDVKPSDKVLIVGPGPMGLLALQMLKAQGAFVAMSGIEGDQNRLQLARNLGADLTVVTGGRTEKVLDEYTNGKGFDFVFDCAGVESSLKMDIDLVGKCGTIVQIAIPKTTGIFIANYSNVVMKEIRIVGSFSHRYLDWDKTLNMIGRGLLRIKPLISHHFRLEQCKEAFQAENKLKVVFDIYPKLHE